MRWTDSMKKDLEQKGSRCLKPDCPTDVEASHPALLWDAVKTMEEKGTSGQSNLT